jgi:integrase
VHKTLQPHRANRHCTIRRVRSRIAKVIGFAMTKGWCPKRPNPAAWEDNLVNLLPNLSNVIEVRLMPALHYTEIGTFVAQLRRYHSEYIAVKALEFLILTAVRTNEVRGARWREIDWEARKWTVPKDRTKMRRDHEVPLSEAARAILTAIKGNRTVEELRPEGFIFACEAGDHLPFHEDGMLELCKRLRRTSRCTGSARRSAIGPATWTTSRPKRSPSTPSPTRSAPAHNALIGAGLLSRSGAS